jgi:hypothetical protein
MGETAREGASGSLRRKSGDRPGARHWAFPAAQGGPESFLVVLGSIRFIYGKIAGMAGSSPFSVFQQSASIGIDPLLDTRIWLSVLHAQKALQLHRSACVH